MRKALIGALMIGALSWTAPAAAQQASITQSIAGTRLDITATGEVTRVPDVAIISAGVVSRAATASAAMQDAANRMDRVLAALKRAGVESRELVNPSPRRRIVVHVRDAVADAPPVVRTLELLDQAVAKNESRRAA